MFNLPTGRRMLALVLFCLASSLVFAAPQTAILSFSTNDGAIRENSGSFGINIDLSDPTHLQITSVALIIDGYRYKVKDVEFIYDPIEDICYIGGLAFGGNALDEETRDFYLSWHPKPAGQAQTEIGAGFVSVSLGMSELIQDFATITIVETKRRPKKP